MTLHFPDEVNTSLLTIAIAVAGRGFEARIATELAVPLARSACVDCDNCIGWRFARDVESG